MDLLLSLFTLAALVYFVGWKDWLRPLLFGPRQESVSNKPARRAFKLRSQRSQRSEPLNAGSGQHNEESAPVNVPNVQASAGAPAAPPAAAAAAGDQFTLSARELVQLAEALRLRAEGSTVEQAVCQAFGVSKGGSEGYKRAKGLFDAATVTPGAAPAGTYAAPARRRARRRAAPAR